MWLWGSEECVGGMVVIVGVWECVGGARILVGVSGVYCMGLEDCLCRGQLVVIIKTVEVCRGKCVGVCS